jgi:hypothetical protein
VPSPFELWQRYLETSLAQQPQRTPQNWKSNLPPQLEQLEHYNQLAGRQSAVRSPSPIETIGRRCAYPPHSSQQLQQQHRRGGGGDDINITASVDVTAARLAAANLCVRSLAAVDEKSKTEALNDNRSDGNGDAVRAGRAPTDRRLFAPYPIDSRQPKHSLLAMAPLLSNLRNDKSALPELLSPQMKSMLPVVPGGFFGNGVWSPTSPPSSHPVVASSSAFPSSPPAADPITVPARYPSNAFPFTSPPSLLPLQPDVLSRILAANAAAEEALKSSLYGSLMSQIMTSPEPPSAAVIREHYRRVAADNQQRLTLDALGTAAAFQSNVLPPFAAADFRIKPEAVSQYQSTAAAHSSSFVFPNRLNTSPTSTTFDTNTGSGATKDLRRSPSNNTDVLQTAALDLCQSRQPSHIAASSASSPSSTSSSVLDALAPHHVGINGTGSRPSVTEATTTIGSAAAATRGHRALPYPLRRKDGRMVYECNDCKKTFGQLSNLKVGSRKNPFWRQMRMTFL